MIRITPKKKKREKGHDQNVTIIVSSSSSLVGYNSFSQKTYWSIITPKRNWSNHIKISKKIRSIKESRFAKNKQKVHREKGKVVLKNNFKKWFENTIEDVLVKIFAFLREKNWPFLPKPLAMQELFSKEVLGNILPA